MVDDFQKNHVIRVKRVYDPITTDDGYRILKNLASQNVTFLSATKDMPLCHALILAEWLFAQKA